MKELRILVVDRDEQMVGLLCKFLGSRGVDAHSAASKEAALEFVSEDRVDVLIVDHELDQDGEVIKKAGQGTTVILLKTSKAIRQSFDISGVYYQLKKPFSGKHLLTILRGIAANAEQREGEDSKVAGVAKVGGLSSLNLNVSRRPTSPVQKRIQVQPVDDGLASTGGNMVMTLMTKMGTLEQTPFPSLLYKIFANQSTGILTVHRSGSERMIYFLEGVPVCAMSNSVSDSLGAVLVNLGFLKMSQLNTALEDRLDGQALGNYLLKARLVTNQQLLAALDRQVYERILSCFSFTAGQYVFLEESDWISEVKVFKQNPIQLIVDGVGQFVGPNVLATQLQPHLDKYVVRTEKFDKFKPFFPVDPVTSVTLDLIDGSRKLRDMTSGNDLMGLLRLVWSLHLADMVDFLESSRSEAQRSSKKPPLPIGGFPKKIRSEGSGVTGEAAELESRVLEFYVRLGFEDHWQLLGVDRDVNNHQVRDAFRKALDWLPPERFKLLSPGAREKAHEVHEALKKAVNTISQPMSRSQYIKRLKRRRPEPAPTPSPDPELQRSAAPAPTPIAAPELSRSAGDSDISAIENEKLGREFSGQPRMSQDTELQAARNLALIDLQRARECAAQEQWKEALKHIKRAATTTPQSQDVIVFQTWIVYNLPHDDRERQVRVCRKRLRYELSIDSGLIQAYYFLGRICEEEGDFTEALEQYRAAVLLDPSHKGALMGLAHVESLTSNDALVDLDVDDDLRKRLQAGFTNDRDP